MAAQFNFANIVGTIQKVMKNGKKNWIETQALATRRREPDGDRLGNAGTAIECTARRNQIVASAHERLCDQLADETAREKRIRNDGETIPTIF